MINVSEKLLKNEKILYENKNEKPKIFLNHPFFHANSQSSVFRYYSVECYITNFRIIIIGMQSMSTFSRSPRVRYKELFIEYQNVGDIEVFYNYQIKRYCLYISGVDGGKNLAIWNRDLAEKTNFSWYFELEQKAFDLLISRFEEENPKVIIKYFLEPQDANIFKEFSQPDLLIDKNEKLLWSLEVNDKKDFLKKIIVSLILTGMFLSLYGNSLPLLENGVINLFSAGIIISSFLIFYFLSFLLLKLSPSYLPSTYLLTNMRCIVIDFNFSYNVESFVYDEIEKIELRKESKSENFFSVYLFPKKTKALLMKKEEDKYLFRLNKEGEEILKKYCNKIYFG